MYVRLTPDPLDAKHDEKSNAILGLLRYLLLDGCKVTKCITQLPPCTKLVNAAMRPVMVCDNPHRGPVSFVPIAISIVALWLPAPTTYISILVLAPAVFTG